MTKKLKNIFFLMLVFNAVFLCAQEYIQQKTSQAIDWKINKQIVGFKNAVYPSVFSGLPVYSYSLNISNSTNIEVKIDNAFFEPLSGISLTPSQIKLIENHVIVNKTIGIDRKQHIANISIFPFRNNNGTIEILKSFDLSALPVNSTANRLISGNTERNYVSNSLLNTGKWYKIGVSHAGVYKLDYSFLKNLGIAVDIINPADIRIFGHRAGMLPELAGADKDDDIREIPLKVNVAAAGRFQPNDYVLAYLPGPEKWTYSTDMFTAKKHIFSNTKNFFITTDAGAGARISSVSSSPLPETKNITTYNDYAFIEDNRINIAQSGRQFVGDEFGGITDKSYNFNFPNLISSSPVKLKIAVIGRSKTSGSVFNLSSDNSANFNSIFIPNVAVPYPGIDDAGTKIERQFTLSNLSSNFNINLNFDRNGDFNTKGWLDYIQINAISTLRYNGQPLYFRNINSVGAGAISKFEIENMNANVEIWDVTNPFGVQKILYNLSGNIASFNIATDSLKEFVAIETSNETPMELGTIANQNLHAMPQQDMLIVTRTAFLQQAEALAQFHRNKQNLRVAVVELNQVYNEFSSGTNDVTAIRDFTKMFYDRANGNVAQMPKYLLLFGDGTYDNLNLGDFYIPTYESDKSYETLETYVSDDFFGILDDNEGTNITNTAAEIADVAVGRIPADDVSKAQIAVDKINMYYSSASYGDWRNQGTFIADDEDFNIHIADANSFADNYGDAEKKSNVDKIYLDAYQQQSAAGGTTYPAVNEAISRKLFTGTLFLNYVGHGGPLGLSKERILTVDDIAQWQNVNKLPLFITATCEFAPYDAVNDFTAGERVLFKQDGGGIALVTTTRVVYSNRNKTMNDNFMAQMVSAYTNAQMTLGDIVREAKKYTNTFDGNRKFSLLGDPALRLAFPKYNVVATQINNVGFSSPHDTLKALSKITIDGEVRDNSNSIMNSFNGIASVNIYDKVKTINTLVNDPVGPDNPDGSLPFDFKLQKNTIYKGKVKVTNGKFKINFLVPKDIDYNFGNGKISMYASSDTTDAAGYTSDIIIGGASDTILTDNQGPDVDVFLNDDKFVFGGITDESPKLFTKLFDENGINTSGNGVGHDITAIIDNDTKKIFNLNDFYETNIDDITRGVVSYPFSKLAKGRHTLQVKAWDVLNNSGVGYTEFIVEEKANLALSHVLNYPNPFTTNTRFMFEHNKPGAPLDLRIEIFTVSGKVIKTITKNINTEGYRVDDITWDGLDDYGDKIGKGVYIYRISLKDDSGKKVSQYQKLVILN